MVTSVTYADWVALAENNSIDSFGVKYMYVIIITFYIDHDSDITMILSDLIYHDIIMTLSSDLSITMTTVRIVTRSQITITPHQSAKVGMTTV